jgi:hypothetical protein
MHTNANLSPATRELLRLRGLREKMKAGDFVFFNDGKAQVSTPVVIVAVFRDTHQVRVEFPTAGRGIETVSLGMVHPEPKYGMVGVRAE